MTDNNKCWRDPEPISPPEPDYDPNQVPEKIKNYTEQTRTKRYGIDTREAMARAAAVAGVISQEALDTSQDAYDNTESMQQQINQLVIEGDSSVEAAQARVRTVDGQTTVFDTLKDRNDDTDTRLQSTETKSVTTVQHYVSNNVKVAFQDDDGHIRLKTILKPQVFDPEAVPCTAAVVTSWIGGANRVTWEDLEDMRNDGWSIVNHSNTHIRLGQQTDDVAEEEIVTAKRILNSRGFAGDILVYPFGDITDKTVEIAKRHTIAAMTTLDNYNQMPVRSQRIGRFSCIGTPGVTLQQCKDVIDNAPDDALIIFFSHAYEESYDNPQVIAEFRELIQYIKSKGIEIVNTEDALNLKNNILDVGDRYNYIRIGRNGKVDISDWNDQTIDNDTPISYFPLGTSRVYFNFADAQAKGFPGDVLGTDYGPAAGTLITSRIQPAFYSSGEYASFQLYLGATSNRVFKRRWNVDNGEWTQWRLIQDDLLNYPFHVVNSERNKYSASTPLTGFPARQISTFYFNPTNSAGFPVESGMVTTYRMNEDAWNRQECRGVNDRNVWQRYWTGTEWSIWERPVTTLGQLTRTISATTIPANSTIDFMTEVASIRTTHTHVARPEGTLESGVTWQCYAPEDGKVIIRLTNVTTSGIPLVQRTWEIHRLTHN